MISDRPVLDFAAVLFDLDGVLTSTAIIHEAAWKAMFDEFLLARAEAHGEPFVAFTNDDYLRYVDGKPRFDGVRAFLASRDIELPDGDVDAEPLSDSIAGLGNRKNRLLIELLDERGVDPLPGAVESVRAMRAAGIRTAVVSSSANTERVLASAGLGEMFDTVVDGNTARRLGLAGKPAPDTFLEAARRLGVAPQDAVVVEDALAGVAAGRAGGFGLVVGIASPTSSAALLDEGADVVVASLAELLSD